MNRPCAILLFTFLAACASPQPSYVDTTAARSADRAGATVPIVPDQGTAPAPAVPSHARIPTQNAQDTIFRRNE